ncbi:MAG: hypothetical protein ACE5KX_05740 [Acidimicrobiia bacterium]
MGELREGGLRVELPTGWDGEIYRRPGAPSSPVARDEGETTHSILHAANFALPTERGDFGSGAVEVMKSRDVLIVLFEYHPDSVDTALFRHRGLPIPLDPDSFSLHTVQHPIEGQAGTQRFFSAGGRAFCLYVVLGSYQRRAQLVPLVNSVLQRLDFGP